MSDLPENYVIFNNSDKELDDNLEKCMSNSQELLKFCEQKQEMDKCEAIQNVIDRFTSMKQVISQEREGKIMIEAYQLDTIFNSLFEKG